MNQNDKRDVATIALLGAGLGTIGIFGNYAPALTDCQRNGADPLFVGGLRRAYLASWALSLGFGALVALADESVAPLVATVGAGAAMTLIYELELPEHHRLKSPLELFKTNGNLPVARDWGV